MRADNKSPRRAKIIPLEQAGKYGNVLKPG
jgi:hypothetical protein